MSRFPTAGHLLSWAGLCPRNDESAGKRRSTRLRKRSLAEDTLVQCACRHPQDGSYLQAQFHRLRARRGTKKAICAVAASMLRCLPHAQDGTEYQDLGASHSTSDPSNRRPDASSNASKTSASRSTLFGLADGHDLSRTSGIVAGGGRLPDHHREKGVGFP